MNLDERQAALEYLGQLQSRGVHLKIDMPLSLSETKDALDSQAAALQDMFGHLYPFEIAAELQNAMQESPDPSPMPTPLLFDVLKTKCNLLNSLLERADGEVFVPPVIGILPGPSLSPLQIRVPFSKAHLVVIPLQLFLYCHLFALALSVLLNPRPLRKQDAVQLSLNPEDLDFGHPKRAKALAHLEFIIVTHALMGRSLLAPAPSIGPRHQIFRDLLLDAMELFAIAHEYGHFIADHGQDSAVAITRENLEIIEFMKSQEFEADLVGQSLTVVAGRRSGNPLAMRNIGGVILLLAVDFEQRARWILENGKTSRPPSLTHPDIGVRLENLREKKLDQWPSLIDKPTQDMHTMIQKLMEKIWSEFEPRLIELHESGIRPLSFEE